MTLRRVPLCKSLDMNLLLLKIKMNLAPYAVAVCLIPVDCGGVFLFYLLRFDANHIYNPNHIILCQLCGKAIQCRVVGFLCTLIRAAAMIGEQSGDSQTQVRRYIRLTELIPEILSMVDSGRIALTPAVELSYLSKQEQRDLMETMESEDGTPSLSQAIQMKKLSQAGELDMDKIFDILREPKANQIDKISFRTADIRKYFPKTYSTARIHEYIIKLLEADYRKRQRAQER